MNPKDPWPVHCDSCGKNDNIFGHSLPEARKKAGWKRVYGTGMATGEIRDYCPKCGG